MRCCSVSIAHAILVLRTEADIAVWMVLVIFANFVQYGLPGNKVGVWSGHELHFALKFGTTTRNLKTPRTNCSSVKFGKWSNHYFYCHFCLWISKIEKVSSYGKFFVEFKPPEKGPHFFSFINCTKYINLKLDLNIDLTF